MVLSATAEPPAGVNLQRLLSMAKGTYKLEANKPSTLSPVDIVMRVRELLEVAAGDAGEPAEGAQVLRDRQEGIKRYLLRHVADLPVIFSLLAEDLDAAGVELE